MPNKLAQDIENVIKPLTGGLIAKVTVKSQCTAIGTTPDAIGTGQLDSFCTRLELALRGLGKNPNEIRKVLDQVKRFS